jgi:Enoyl-CoA hydratase/isomerase
MLKPRPGNPAEEDPPVAYQTIILEVENQIATIRLNRPEALNALNDTLLGELAEALAEMDRSTRVRAIVLTARPRPSLPAPTSRRWRREASSRCSPTTPSARRPTLSSAATSR